MVDKIMPHAVELEQSIIAALLLDADAGTPVFKTLCADDFYKESHRVIFRTLNQLYDAGTPADVALLSERLLQSGKLEKAGGAAYVAGLLDEPYPSSVPTYCAKIKEKANLRRLIESCTRSAQDAYAAGNLNDLVTQLETTISEIRATDQTEQRRIAFQKVGEIKPKSADWLIKGLFEKDSLVEIFGDPGAGKSFIGIDIASCAATGTNFHGHQIKPGPALYIAGEGQNGIFRRFKAWAIRHQKDLSESPLYLSSMPANLCDENAAAEIKRAIQETEQTPALIVFDTVARNFGPGDENSTQDMTQFINALDQIRTEYRCAILLIHHCGHGDKSRSRGAMALKGALDAEYRMTKDERDVVRLENTKAKDFAPPEPLAFKIHKVELGFKDEDGEEITSAILDQVDYEPETKPNKQGKWQKLAKEQLDILYQEHRTRLEQGNLDPAQAKVLISDWRDACLKAGMPRNRFYDLQKKFRTEHNYVYPE